MDTGAPTAAGEEGHSTAMSEVSTVALVAAFLGPLILGLGVALDQHELRAPDAPDYCKAEAISDSRVLTYSDAAGKHWYAFYSAAHVLVRVPADPPTVKASTQ